MTIPAKLVLHSDRLNGCDIGLVQNTAVGSFILPFGIKYTTKISLLILLQTYKVATVCGPRFSSKPYIKVGRIIAL